MKDEISPVSGQNSFPTSERSAPAESPASSFRLHRSSLLKWLVRVCRFGLAAFFLFTAGAKLWFISFFVKNVGELLSSMHFNYERWMWPATVVVISIELVTALLLLLPRTVRLGALLSAALLIGFSAFALYYVYVLHGEALECGCFGNLIGSQLGVKTALRNLGLLVPALLVFFGYPRVRRSAAGDLPASAAIAEN
jgi:hypothetical protein